MYILTLQAPSACIPQNAVEFALNNFTFKNIFEIVTFKTRIIFGSPNTLLKKSELLKLNSNNT